VPCALMCAMVRTVRNDADDICRARRSDQWHAYCVDIEIDDTICLCAFPSEPVRLQREMK